MDNQTKFQNIYGQYADPILRYALRRVANADQAADVVSETFTVAWQKLDAVPNNEEAKYWLYGVARKVLANQRRKNTRADELRNALQNYERLSNQQDFTNSTDDSMAVQKALSQLSQDDRDLITLSNWEGFKSNEIAQIMDLPAGTVRSRRNRINSELRKLLEKSNNFHEQFGQTRHTPIQAADTAAEEQEP